MYSISRFKEIFTEKLDEVTWKNLRKTGINLTPNKRIMDAIANRRQVDLTYVDNNGIRTHRNVEIYAYGISRAHNQIIRVFQTWGNSATMGRNEKGWRTLRVDRIERMRVLNTFSAFDKNPKFRYNVPGYKMNDKDMIYIFRQVNFNDKPKTPDEKAQQDRKQVYVTPDAATSAAQRGKEPLMNTPQSQTEKPEVNQDVLQQLAVQGAKQMQSQGAINTDTGRSFQQDFRNKIDVIKDKLESDATSDVNNDDIDDGSPIEPER